MKYKLENAPLYEKAIYATIEAYEYQHRAFSAGLALRHILLGEGKGGAETREKIVDAVRVYVESRYEGIFDAMSDRRYDLNIYSPAAWAYLMPTDALDDLARFLCGEEFTEGGE